MVSLTCAWCVSGFVRQSEICFFSRPSGSVVLFRSGRADSAAQDITKCDRPDFGSGQLGDWICAPRCLMHHTGLNIPGG
jgi:hypothetical protein